MQLNADPRQRVALDTNQLDWLDADGAHAGAVSHKPLANSGGEAAMRTDIVRYAAGAQIWQNESDGAEMLVLEGSVQDAAGDYPAGSYLKLPCAWPGRLTSAAGCTLFVKRGHLDCRDQRPRMLRPAERVWHPGLVPGLNVLSLAEYDGAHTALVNWDPGTLFQPHRHYGGEEIFVIAGVFQDEHGDYPAGTWLRSPHMSEHVPFSEPGCLIFVKVGHLPV